MPLRVLWSRRSKQQHADFAAAFATRDQPRTAAHDEAEPPALVPLYVLDVAEVYQQRPLDLHEPQRRQPQHHVLQGRAGQKLAGADVRDDVVARGLEVLDLLSREKIDVA